MKYLLLSSRRSALVCAFFILTSGIAQDIRWEKSYGGVYSDFLFDMIPTADYGFILAGSSLSGKTGNKSSVNHGDLDYFVWKMDEFGDMDWQRSFGGVGLDLLKQVRITADGGFILAGTSNSPKGAVKTTDNIKGSSDFWIIKLDAGGGEQWQKTFGGAGADELAAIVCLPDGYLFGGNSDSSPLYDEFNNLVGQKSTRSRGGLDYWLVRTNATGEVEWERTFGGIYVDQLRSISPTGDGGFLVGGYSTSPMSGDKTESNWGGGDFWVFKIDKFGVIEWQRAYGGDGDDQLYVISRLRDGNYIVAGNSSSGPSGNKQSSNRNGSDFWVLKIEENGNIIWQQNYDFGANDILTSVVENRDGTLLIGGTAKAEDKNSEGINDFIALKINAQGEEIWRKSLGSEGEDVLKKLIMTRDGGYLLAGTSNPDASRIHARKAKRKSLSKKGGLNNIPTDEMSFTQGSEAIDNFMAQTTDQVSELTDQAKQFAGLTEDSPLNVGLNLPQSFHAPSAGTSGSSPDGAPSKTKALPSRDKSKNFGGHDFWVVKLKDRDKKNESKLNIEAIPNPAKSFTNVVVGYDFEKGEASLYDISGRQLQKFTITTGRTVPISLEHLPQGIYIVEINTEHSTDAVKIMKSN